MSPTPEEQPFGVPPGDVWNDVPLFREIQRVLMSSSGPVNWELARQVGIASASWGTEDPAPGEADRRGFEEAVRVAELQVAGFTGLEAPIRHPEGRGRSARAVGPGEHRRAAGRARTGGREDRRRDRRRAAGLDPGAVAGRGRAGAGAALAAAARRAGRHRPGDARPAGAGAVRHRRAAARRLGRAAVRRPEHRPLREGVEPGPDRLPDLDRDPRGDAPVRVRAAVGAHDGSGS